MTQISVQILRGVIMTIVLALLPTHAVTLPDADAPIIRTVDIGHGITLHYTEAGNGTPLIFCPRVVKQWRVLGRPDRPIR